LYRFSVPLLSTEVSACAFFRYAGARKKIVRLHHSCGTICFECFALRNCAIAFASCKPRTRAEFMQFSRGIATIDRKTRSGLSKPSRFYAGFSSAQRLLSISPALKSPPPRMTAPVPKLGRAT